MTVQPRIQHVSAQVKVLTGGRGAAGCERGGVGTGVGAGAGGAVSAFVVMATDVSLPSPFEETGITLKLYLVPDNKPLTLISRISEATVVTTTLTPAQTWQQATRVTSHTSACQHSLVCQLAII